MLVNLELSFLQEQFKPASSVRRPNQHSIQIPESFKQAVREAGLLEEMEREGFELVEAREAKDDEIPLEEEEEADKELTRALEKTVDDKVDEELLDELLSNSRRQQPHLPRISPVSFTDDLGSEDGIVSGLPSSGAGLGAFGGLR